MGTGFRLTELVAALSLATDLGTGQPIEHALRTCTLSTSLAGELGLDAASTADIYHVALLRFLGCTADAPETALLAGGDNIAFLSAMASVIMGSTGETVATLVRSVGRGRSAVRRIRLVAGALSDPNGAARSLSAHCEVGARLAVRLGLGDGVVDALAHAYERWDGRG
ncbi:MAG: HD domain-containing phosphohydrolase, partial [Pseudonocardiaceae bacterium]